MRRCKICKTLIDKKYKYCYKCWKKVKNWSERKRKYHDYLRKSHWLKISKEYKERFPICEVCRKNKSTQVHHKTYKNLGKEEYWDLIAVCEECHKKKHSKVVRTKDN